MKKLADDIVKVSIAMFIILVLYALTKNIFLTLIIAFALTRIVGKK